MSKGSLVVWNNSVLQVWESKEQYRSTSPLDAFSVTRKLICLKETAVSLMGVYESLWSSS